MIDALILGYILDLIFGDPHFIYHYVQLIGKLISYLDKKLNKRNLSKKQLNRAGAYLFFIVTISSVLVATTILFIAYRINYYLYYALYVFIIYQSLATSSLARESNKVLKELKRGSLESARVAISYIVGRDTKNLNKNQIREATVETIAENTSDGIIAPLFYLFLLGPLGGVFYKAVNTMDSMIGYKSEKYKYFGSFAAICDDILNFIPSRLSALFMIIASIAPTYSFKGAIKIFYRDRFNHESPNSAQCESVASGALSLRLAGPTSYNGVLKDKPYIGDHIKEINNKSISKMMILMYITSLIAFLSFYYIRNLIYGIL
jgi:adenosylcobinamide-phosphate synthase